MPRLVRRKPALERLKDYLNLADWLLWLSEEIETREWDSKAFATPLALGIHFVFLVARANSGSVGRNDDIFGDEPKTSWLGSFATLLVYILTLGSIFNAGLAFTRKRNYRLFESPVEKSQNTPSARRVRVDSSPASSSPLRFLTNILGDTGAESRAHPDPTRDVWEISIWDPRPASLRLFTLFSPAHVLVYWLFLPTVASDPRPSVTVFKTLVLQILLSIQAIVLETAFSQQEKDTAIIAKEVMNEYDIKFVHPLLNPVMRDVGTQYRDSGRGAEGSDDVETYTPTVILKRGFRTNPNPDYKKHVDPDDLTGITRTFSPTPAYTPSAYNSREPTPFNAITSRPPIRQPQFRQSHGGMVSAQTSTGDGGSLGVFNHANSPLKKATSMYDMPNHNTPRNNREMASREIAAERERERSASPNKRRSDGYPRAPGGNLRRPFQNLDGDRRTSAPNALGPSQRGNGYGESPLKRGPSRY